jgi:xanthine dehydrogenase accessory factor
MSGMQFVEFFDERRRNRSALVLITIFATDGSTYSKPGQRMLVDTNGQCSGLVSGGCLEGDLIEQAKQVFIDGNARTVTYNLRGENDELWGLGLGCGGTIRLLLQRVDSSSNYEPLSGISTALQSEWTTEIVIVTRSKNPRLPSGTTLIRASGSPEASCGIEIAAAQELELLANTASARGDIRLASGLIDGHLIQCLCQTLSPIPRVLVLGAGPDAAPLVTGCTALGWRVTIGDHRPAYLNRPDFGNVQRHLTADSIAVRSLLATARYSAVVVMSHNLAADERYLKALVDEDIAYIGLLGPRHRCKRLLDRLEPAAVARIEHRLRSPVGLDIGADSPASIALSVVAEMYATLRNAPRRRSAVSRRFRTLSDDASAARPSGAHASPGPNLESAT